MKKSWSIDRYQLDEFNQHSQKTAILRSNVIRANSNRLPTRTGPTIVIGDSVCSIVVRFFFSLRRYLVRLPLRRKNIAFDSQILPFVANITGLTRLHTRVNLFSALFGRTMVQYVASVEQSRSRMRSG